MLVLDAALVVPISHRLSSEATMWMRGMTSCAGSAPLLMTVTWCL